MAGGPKPTISYRDLIKGLRELGLERSRPVIAHASLSAFGEVRGGASTLLGAVLALVDTLVMPAFTYKTMLTPEAGPENNAIVYGSGRDTNRMAEFFSPDMPADRLMGILPETLRLYPGASRSSHPILSFAGVHAGEVLQAQTLAEPLAPVRILLEQDGLVLLLGVDHTTNTSIHFAERLAGRRQFTRWALTPAGVRACPGFPGCSDGFEALAPHLEGLTRRVQIGGAQVQAVPLSGLVETIRARLAEDPGALLCSRAGL